MNIEAQLQIAKSVLVLSKNAEHDQSSHGNRGGGSSYGSADITELKERRGVGGDVRIVGQRGKVLGLAEFDMKTQSYDALVYEDRKVKYLGVRSRDRDEVVSAIVDYLSGGSD